MEEGLRQKNPKQTKKKNTRVSVTAYCTVVIYSEVRQADRREPGNKRIVVDTVAGKEVPPRPGRRDPHARDETR